MIRVAIVGSRRRLGVARLVPGMVRPAPIAPASAVSTEDFPAAALDSLIAGRQPTHGDFADTAEIAQHIKSVFIAAGAGRFDAPQREALDQIAVKLARILAGDPACAEHWRDLAGYAWLAATHLAG